MPFGTPSKLTGALEFPGYHFLRVEVEGDEDDGGLAACLGGDTVGYDGDGGEGDGADQVSGQVVDEQGVEVALDGDLCQGLRVKADGLVAATFDGDVFGWFFVGVSAPLGFEVFVGSPDSDPVDPLADDGGDDDAAGYPEFFGLAGFLVEYLGEAPGGAGAEDAREVAFGLQPAEPVFFDGGAVEAALGQIVECWLVGEKGLMGTVYEFARGGLPSFSRGARETGTRNSGFGTRRDGGGGGVVSPWGRAGALAFFVDRAGCALALFTGGGVGLFTSFAFIFAQISDDVDFEIAGEAMSGIAAYFGDKFISVSGATALGAGTDVAATGFVV